MSDLFGSIRGGMAVSVIIVGALLAASTGIVGATVITMGLISLPPMLKQGYPPTVSTGVIAASGTLGQIIPPSVVLVLLGSVLQVSVGDLFKAALYPSLLLVGAYIVYILGLGILKPSIFPKGNTDKETWNIAFFKRLLSSLFLPLLLIVAVLGSILLGLASPTEAAAIGAAGAMILTLSQGKLTWKVVKDVCRDTTHLTSMVFMILLGATTFSLVFRELGGDQFLIQLIEHGDLTEYQFLALVMVVVFVAGFFIDFIEIVFIIVPVVTPIFIGYGTDLIWLGILLGINLQTSFLSPPFGFALFYLKGVAPPEVKTIHLYKGILPFLVIQVLLLVTVLFFPEYLGIV
jgi:tripartite ATP-independent transporter DctM subunit